MIGWVNMMMLAGLAAVAIPIAIHLLRNRRFENADLGTLRFLQQAVHESSKWRRIRNLLLLALRLLIIILLALLFARPYLIRGASGSDRDADVIVLLDGSGSMHGRFMGRSLWDAVRAARDDILGSLPESAQVTTAVFADGVLRVDGELPADLPAGAGTDYGAALSWAADRLSNSKAAFREILMLTDMQRIGLPREPLHDWPGDISVRIQPLPEPGEFNLGIAAVRCLTPVPESAARFAVQLVASGRTPRDPVHVQCRIDGADDMQRSVLPQTQETVFTWDDPKPGICRGTITIVNTKDAWPADDQFSFAFRLLHPARILVLDQSYSPQDRQKAESYFLLMALAKERNEEGRAPYTLLVKPTLPQELDVEALIIADPPKLDQNDLETLSAAVRAGMGLLVFLGEWADERNTRTWQDHGLLPGAMQRTKIPIPARIEQWDTNHPMLSPFRAEEQNSLGRIVFRDAFTCLPAEGAAVAASLSGGNPALVTHSLGEGRVVTVTNPPSRTWTDWPIQPIYLPLMREITAYAARLQERRQSLDSATASITNGRSAGVSEDHGTTAIYPNPDEVRVERCSMEEFRTALGLGEEAVDSHSARSAALPPGRQRQSEVWRWIALALASLLLIESVTADWRAAQPHRPHDAARSQSG